MVIHCDNQAVVTILNSGGTRESSLAAMARNIAMITALNDIELRVVHIPGKDNVIADNLSTLALGPQYRNNLFISV